MTVQMTFILSCIVYIFFSKIIYSIDTVDAIPWGGRFLERVQIIYAIDFIMFFMVLDDVYFIYKQGH